MGLNNTSNATSFEAMAEEMNDKAVETVETETEVTETEVAEDTSTKTED